MSVFSSVSKSIVQSRKEGLFENIKEYHSEDESEFKCQ